MKQIIGFLTIDFDRNRVYGLDILRAIAIFFVVFLHGTILLPSWLGPILFMFLFDGVSIFFVLSGFLIGKIIITTLETKQPVLKTLTDFWVKRWFRTLPNYFLVLLLLCSLSAYFHKEFNLWEVRKYFFFLQNFSAPQPRFFGEAWSLSVEEWSYIIAPSIIFALVHFKWLTRKNAVLITAVLIIVVTIGVRYFKYVNMGAAVYLPDRDAQFRNPVIMRLDSIMYGLIGAYLSYYYQSIWIRYKNWCLAIGIILLLGIRTLELFGIYEISPFYASVFAFPAFELAVLFFLPFLSQVKKGNGFVYRMITYISISSYSIYLLHLSIIQRWILDRLPHAGLSGVQLTVVKYILYWALTFVLAIVAYKYFEKPMMDLRTRLKRKKPVIEVDQLV